MFVDDGKLGAASPFMTAAVGTVSHFSLTDAEARAKGFPDVLPDEVITLEMTGTMYEQYYDTRISEIEMEDAAAQEEAHATTRAPSSMYMICSRSRRRATASSSPWWTAGRRSTTTPSTSERSPSSEPTAWRAQGRAAPRTGADGSSSTAGRWRRPRARVFDFEHGGRRHLRHGARGRRLLAPRRRRGRDGRNNHRPVQARVLRVRGRFRDGRHPRVQRR